MKTVRVYSGARKKVLNIPAHLLENEQYVKKHQLQIQDPAMEETSKVMKRKVEGSEKEEVKEVRNEEEVVDHGFEAVIPTEEELVTEAPQEVPDDQPVELPEQPKEGNKDDELRVEGASPEAEKEEKKSAPKAKKKTQKKTTRTKKADK